MRIKFRKAEGVKSPDLYEWKSDVSNKWYKIYRDNIYCIEGQYAEQTIINQAEDGKTVLLEGTYLKQGKVLLIKREIG